MVVSVSSSHVCVLERGHANGAARLWSLEDSSSVSPHLPPCFIRVRITAVHSRLADERASAGSPLSTSIWTEGSWDYRGPLLLHHVGGGCSLTASPLLAEPSSALALHFILYFTLKSIFQFFSSSSHLELPLCVFYFINRLFVCVLVCFFPLLSPSTFFYLTRLHFFF